MIIHVNIIMNINILLHRCMLMTQMKRDGGAYSTIKEKGGES
jgi:hypothetical protein